jgi:Na+-transporting methylmalonyl-CoA/oxaloacetate decarboxylase gamma subunit
VDLSELGQGLTLSGIGILITFSALAILILLIVLLKAIFPVRSEEAGIESSSGKDEDLRQQAAAVGVAVLIGRKSSSVRKGSLGALLENPPGSWWRKGLDRIQGKEG